MSKLEDVLDGARKAAIAYYEMTGKPLGITGEMAECQAAKILNLELAAARTPGYDAIDGQGRRIQIKSKRVVNGRSTRGHRIGAIKLTHEWDMVMLVLLDEHFDAFAIYQADRAIIKRELLKPGSKARNVRGALPVSTIKKHGEKVWPR